MSGDGGGTHSLESVAASVATRLTRVLTDTDSTVSERARPVLGEHVRVAERFAAELSAGALPTDAAAFEAAVLQWLSDVAIFSSGLRLSDEQSKLSPTSYEDLHATQTIAATVRSAIEKHGLAVAIEPGSQN